MKNFIFLAVAASALTAQVTLCAQSNYNNADDNDSRPTIDVEVRRLPSNDEGNYHDNTIMSAPRVRVHYQDDTQGQGGFNGYNYDNNIRDNRGPVNSRASSNYSTDNDNYNKGANRPVAVEDTEQTLSIIKPDAVRGNHIGDIISRFERAGLRVAAIKMTTLTTDQVEKFYKEHRDRPYFKDLTTYMTSGPVVLLVLQGKQAIAKNRQLMGATNPQQADRGTIRADYANSKTENAVHGSDSQQAAKDEILMFFPDKEVQNRF